jgi:nucleotide-binding universal stress UspA family protein
VSDPAADTESRLPIEHVFHPTDLSNASELAFAHALRIALAAKATLTIFHVAPEGAKVPWSEYPGVRALLERWRLVPPGSPPSAVPKLGIDVEKIAAEGGDPVDASLHYLGGFPAQLVVLATHGRDGLPRWLHRAVAEPLARATRAMSLFVPHGARGFVSQESGDVALARVLVPVDRAPRPSVAVKLAALLPHALGATPRVELLHVGGEGDAPAVNVPASLEGRSRLVTRAGDAVSEIVAAADEAPAADLVVMATAGHDGFLDALRGSTTERVLRQLRCALLAIPEER